MKKVALCLMLVCCSRFLAAQAVKLDSTFGVNGVVTTDLYDENLNPFGSNMIVLPNEEIVIVGGVWDSLIIEKYRNDGVMDTGFTTGPKNLAEYEFGMSVQKDGKILVTGHESVPPYKAPVVRLNVDGGMDTTFGNGGIASTFVEYVYISNLFELSSGKIISFGSESTNDGKPPILVTRLNSDGSIDSTFGTNGQFRRRLSSGYEFIPGGLEQPDGKLLFAGLADWNIMLLRLNPNGELDSTFGLHGILKDPIAGRYRGSEALALELQSDGKILITGDSDNPVAGIVARYNRDGSHDISFGVQGVQYYPGAGGGVDIMIRPSGKIMAAFSGTDNLGNKFFDLAQLLPDGQRDSSFGVNGVYRCPVSNFQPRTLALNNNKLTVSGRYRPSYQVALLRFLLDLNVGALDPGTPADNSLWVYPNPVSDRFTLQFGLLQKERVSVHLFDMNGKLIQSFVQNQSFERGDHSLPLSCDNNLPTGNYVLTLDLAGQKRISIQIMKK